MPQQKDQQNRQNDDSTRSGLQWMAAGVEFCGVIAIFCFGGYKLDQFFGFRIPFLLLTGFFIGFIGMLYLFYKESK